MSGADGLLWTLIALPLVAGTALAVAGRAADRIAAPVAVCAALGDLGLALTAALRHPHAGAPLVAGLPVRLAVDGLSGLMVVTVTAVTLAVLASGIGEFGAAEARARYFGLMLVFAASMLVTVTAVSLPVLLMGWEVMGATSWALIGYRWRDPAGVAAADTAFLTTRTADLGLYLAAGAALAGGGPAGLDLARLSDAAGPWRSVVTAGIIVAALGKSAQLPFSFWLSGAMRGPGPVSALLHSATMVAAGAYLLLRTGPLLEASGWGGAAVAWTGAATAVALGLVAVAQTDLKQLLAASSCAQIGFMVMAAGAGGVTGGTLQLIAHAATKSLLFLAASAWLTALGTRTLSGLSGAARLHRTVGAAFTVGALCLAGLPPLSLWATKDLLLASALGRSPWLYVTGLTAVVLSAAYSAKALWFVLRPAPARDRPEYDTERRGTRRFPPAAVAPLVLLAAACVALTATAFPPVRDAVERVLGTTGRAGPGTWEAALSGAVALTSAATAWVWGGRALPLPPSARAWAEQWLGLERSARLLVVRPVLRLARLSAVLDDRVLDRAVDGSARLTLRLARGTDRVVERAVDGTVTAVAAGARALGALARTPQTGQLHQYLSQAAAAFTLLAVVFVLVR
ncbi:NADH-quinone oxidoreductase subunit L [Streptomyces sp. DT24]|uniref:NADH-quinone oxidoreductase subunit 5 family protein n=1 Tax=Streptomyces sp. DT24 TaxID=3416520 RepID=UPI003CEAB57D